jgi:tetratricopeptide (TPR) repeat protein
VIVSAPLLVWLYDWVFVGESPREMLRRRWPLYAGLATSWLLLAALVAPGHHRQVVGFGFDEWTSWDYLRTQAGVILHYLRLSVWPSPLVLDYGDWVAARSIGEWLVPGLFVLTLVLATAWGVWRRAAWGFLGAWFFLILAPSSSFLPLVSEIAAERRMYLPLAALVVAALGLGRAAGGQYWARLPVRPALARWMPRLLLGALIAAAGVSTMARNEDYRSELSIWTDAVTKRPYNARAHVNLGTAFAHTGRLEEALEQYTMAVRLRPRSAEAHHGWGMVLARQGRRDEAIARFRYATQLKPDYAPAHNSLGIALAQQGDREEAIEHFREALRLRPEDPDIAENLRRAQEQRKPSPRPVVAPAPPYG